MSNVLSLKGSATPFDPVPGVVEELESRLEQARSGHLRAIAFVCVTTGNVAETGWEKAEGSEGVATDTSHALGNGIMTLFWRYARSD